MKKTIVKNIKSLEKKFIALQRQLRREVGKIIHTVEAQVRGKKSTRAESGKKNSAKKSVAKSAFSKSSKKSGTGKTTGPSKKQASLKKRAPISLRKTTR
jgi:hypothetical protein